MNFFLTGTKYERGDGGCDERCVKDDQGSCWNSNAMNVSTRNSLICTDIDLADST